MSDATVASATVTYRVRFDECGPSGAARAAAYLRWAQDVAWIHSEQLGYDRAWYDARSLAWVVRGVQLVILAPSSSGDELAVSTRVTGYRRVWARRRTDMMTPAGTLVGRAYTDWVMTDGRGSPTRVPDEFRERFAVPPDPFEPTRIQLSSVPAEAVALAFAVRPAELDPFGHVNNAVYVDWLDEAADACDARAADGAAPSLRVPRRYRLEYLLATPPAAGLVASAWWEGGGISYALHDSSRRLHLRARLEPDEAALAEGRSPAEG